MWSISLLGGDMPNLPKKAWIFYIFYQPNLYHSQTLHLPGSGPSHCLLKQWAIMSNLESKNIFLFAQSHMPHVNVDKKTISCRKKCFATCPSPRTFAPLDPLLWSTLLERQMLPCPQPPLLPAIQHWVKKLNQIQKCFTSLSASFTLSDFIAAMHASTLPKWSDWLKRM